MKNGLSSLSQNPLNASADYTFKCFELSFRAKRGISHRSEEHDGEESPFSVFQRGSSKPHKRRAPSAGADPRR